MPTRDQIIAELNRRIEAGSLTQRQAQAVQELKRRGVLGPQASTQAVPNATSRREQIAAELKRRIEAGNLTQRQAQVVQELKRRGILGPQAAKQAVPDYMQRVLQQGGVSDTDQARLMATGVTPGTAAEWAVAHIQMNKREGKPVTPGEQEAIFDRYKNQAGRTDLSSRNFVQEQKQREQQQREDTMLGRLHNVGLNVMQDIGELPANLIGTVAPETANEMRSSYAAFLNPNTESVSGKGGQLLGEAFKLPALAATGGVGLATIFGAEGFGGTRREVAALRSQGADISKTAEYTTATGVGLVQGAGAVLLEGIFGKMGRVLKEAPKLKSLIEAGDKGAIKKLLLSSAKFTGGSLKTGAVMSTITGISNAIRQGVNPHVAIADGMGEAFASGILLAPLGALGAKQGGHVPERTRQEMIGQLHPIEAERNVPQALTLQDVTKISSETDPDVRIKPAEQKPTQDFFEAQAKETLANPNDNYVPVDLPLNKVDINPQYQPGVEKAYADMPSETAPRGIAGVDKNTGRFSIIDGNTRAKAAELRGEETVRMWVPETDAKANDLQITGEPAPTSRQLPDEVGVAEQRVSDAQRELEQARQKLETPREGTGVIEVNPSGEATTEAQRRALEEARNQPPRPDTNRLLPGQTAEFVSEGQMVPTEPVRPEPTPKTEAGRQASDAVTEEADALISSLRKGGKNIKPEDEAKIRQLVDEARRNALTGGMNRTAFEKVFGVLRQRSKKSGKPISLIAFDAANLKAYNDKLGESAGDQYLQRVQQVLDSTLRGGGQGRIGDAFHYGGDEFAVLLPDTGAKEAAAVRDRIEQAFGKESIVPGVSAFVVGEPVTVDPASRRSWRNLLDTASAGMKARKLEIKSSLGEATTRNEAQAALAEAGKPVEGVREAMRLLRQRQEEYQAARDQKAERLRTAREVVLKTPPMEGTAHKRRVPQAIEDWVTPIISRIHDISTPIFARLSRMEFDTHRARETLKRDLSDPAFRLKSALKKAGKLDDFKYHVLNQDFDSARSLLRDINPKLADDLDSFSATFRNLLDNQRAAGVTIGDVEDYWPRFIKDYRAFKAEFGKDTGKFEDAWNLARKMKGRHTLTADQKAAIANSVIQGYGPRKPGSVGIPNARARSIDIISRDALSHYADPFDAAFRYIDGATYAAERSRFLGRNHTPENLDETIGSIVQREIDAGRLNKDQQAELHDLLTARFTADILTPSRMARAFKQFVYLMTLGQFRSSLTQLTDVGMTAAEHGIRPTIKGVATTLKISGAERRYMMEDIGLHDTGEEFRDVGRIAKATDWVMRKTGFKALDRFGKESRINSAQYAFSDAAAKPNGEIYRRLKRDYEPVLGQERFRQTMQDIREGKRTEDAKYLLFLDISKVQPLTLSSMPRNYLDMPNGRILYALKTFTAMQLDHVRRDMVRKIAIPGQRQEGLAHLARYIAYFGLVGFGVDILKDWLRGKPVNASDIPDRSVEAMLGTVGLNRYMVGKASEDPVQTAMDYITPPFGIATATWQDLTTNSAGLRSIRYMPVVGELMYYWAPFGRGYHITKELAKKDYRAKLKQLRVEAAKALRNGHTHDVQLMLKIYNDRRKQGPGDGRTKPLTVQNLRGDLKRQLDLTGHETTFGSRLAKKVGFVQE